LPVRGGLPDADPLGYLEYPRHLCDRNGILRWAHIGVGKRNWADRPKIGAVLRVVRGLKH